NLAAVGFHGLDDTLAEVGVLLDEAWAEVVEQAEHVVGDEDLAVAADAGADADGGDLDGRRDLLGHLLWDALDDQGEGPGLLGGQGVFHQLGLIALDAEAPQTTDRLRCQADVAHDRDVGADNGGDTSGAADTAFKLDRMGAALLDEPASVLQGLLRANLEAHERHV